MHEESATEQSDRRQEAPHRCSGSEPPQSQQKVIAHPITQEPGFVELPFPYRYHDFA